MITEYHRPTTVEEALRLLARQEPVTLPLGGGSALNRPSQKPVAVVDLQSLGLDRIERRGHALELGATATLQALLDHPDTPSPLADAIRLEATYNLRQVATAAGTLVAATGRSPFTTALLALDAALVLLPGEEQAGLGEVLPFRSERLRGRLIVRLVLPANARLSFHSVARTPADRPIVCAAAAAWPSGRTRLALGGWGSGPTLAFDGTGAEGMEMAARSAASSAADVWASAPYRQEVAGVLARRCMEDLAA